MAKQKKPEMPLIVSHNIGPFHVVGIDKATGDKGNVYPFKPVTILCRCGASRCKPYCDGSHHDIKFRAVKEADRVKDKVISFKGNEITIHDNRGVCSHDGSCLLLHKVFDRAQFIWIDPDGASPQEIIDTIKLCPSGALSYTLKGEERVQDWWQDPEIRIIDEGPIEVRGGIVFIDDKESEPESAEHYTLCRCGESKNKPFCDGSHRDSDFDKK